VTARAYEERSELTALNGTAGTNPAQMLLAPSGGPSRLNSPVTNGPLSPSGGAAAQVNPAKRVSQKIACSGAAASS
jgi:hypothetical protein